MPSRREVLMLSGAATLGAMASASGVATADSSTPKIKATGYPYDRVSAIRDGQVGIDQHDVEFTVGNIYRMNDDVFGKDTVCKHKNFTSQFDCTDLFKKRN